MNFEFTSAFSIQHSALPLSSLGDIANVGQLEPLALIRLEHQQQPQHSRERRNDDERQKPAERRDGGADEPQGAEPAKDQRRLKRVEPDEAILVFGEEEADAGDPPEGIGQGGCDVFVESERGLRQLLQRPSPAYVEKRSARRGGVVCDKHAANLIVQQHPERVDPERGAEGQDEEIRDSKPDGCETARRATLVNRRSGPGIARARGKKRRGTGGKRERCHTGRNLLTGCRHPDGDCTNREHQCRGAEEQSDCAPRNLQDAEQLDVRSHRTLPTLALECSLTARVVRSLTARVVRSLTARSER